MSEFSTPDAVANAAQRGSSEAYRFIVGGAAVDRQELIIGWPRLAGPEQQIPVGLDRNNFAAAGVVWRWCDDAIAILLGRSGQLSWREAYGEGGGRQREMGEGVPIDLVGQPSTRRVPGIKAKGEFVGPQSGHRRVRVFDGKPPIVGVVDKSLAESVLKRCAVRHSFQIREGQNEPQRLLPAGHTDIGPLRRGAGEGDETTSGVLQRRAIQDRLYFAGTQVGRVEKSGKPEPVDPSVVERISRLR